VRIEVVEESAPGVGAGSALSGFATADTDTTITATRTIVSGSLVRAGLVAIFSIGATIDLTYRIKGLQFESGLTRSSYIPTAGAAVTRAADVLTVPAANLPYPTPKVIGPELVTNGTFDTDTDWVLSAGATISGGTLNNATNTSVFAKQDFPGLVSGRVYLVTYDITVATSGSVSISLGGSVSKANSTVGSYSDIIVGTSIDQVAVTSRFGSAFVGSIDNISVREFDPLALSIQMDGRVTYADTNKAFEARFIRWQTDSNNYIVIDLVTAGAATGSVSFYQSSAGVVDLVTGVNKYSPDILVPFNIASRHGSTFINGAVDGTALVAKTTPTALPSLSTTNLTLGQTYNGTIRTFRMWGQDITDAGLEAATT